MDHFSNTPLQLLVSEAKVRQYPKGQIILYEGDEPDDIYIVKSGALKVYDIDDQGNEKILHIIKSPAVFPFAFFLGNSDENRSFYTSITDVELYVISREFAEKQMKEHGDLAIALMRWFAHETHELLVRLSSLEKSTTHAKICAALKFLAVHHADLRKKDWRRVNFPVSHQMLADMIGVTRESTTMVMKEYQEQKITRTPRLTVLEINFKKLVEMYR